MFIIRAGSGAVFNVDAALICLLYEPVRMLFFNVDCVLMCLLYELVSSVIFKR